jgi:3-isopropylmalate dehydratase small subunit
VTLEADAVEQLFALASAENPLQLTVDLETQIVAASEGFSASFEIDPFRRTCLLEGLDEIGLSLKEADAIRAFEAQHRQSQPWLFTHS